MRCTIPSVNCTLRIARALNDPYGSNELNFPLADRYSAGVLDMTVENARVWCLHTRCFVSEITVVIDEWQTTRIEIENTLAESVYPTDVTMEKKEI